MTEENQTESTDLRAGLNQVLGSIDKGDLYNEAEEELRAAVLAVQETERPAKLVITLTLSPNKKTGAIEVAGDVKATKPKMPRRASIFFPTPEGNLSRYDYNQYNLLDRR